MYDLRIGRYKFFTGSITNINSLCIPRTGEIIKKYKIITNDPNDKLKTIDYHATLEVQSVHHEMFNNSVAKAIVYANIINLELINNE